MLVSSVSVYMSASVHAYVCKPEVDFECLLYWSLSKAEVLQFQVVSLPRHLLSSLVLGLQAAPIIAQL